MSDKLRQHIEDFREDFELYPFEEDAGWQDLQKRMESRVGKKHGARRWLYSIAAGIAILMAAYVVLVSQRSPIIPNEIQEAQFYYQNMIDAKMHLVKDKVDDPQLISDLEDLDKAFIELKEDLKDDVDNQEVVTAMIDNYRLKLKILERILEDIEDDNNEEDITL